MIPSCTYLFSPQSYTGTSNIVHLQCIITQVSSWMSANLLSLNPNRTKFLVIGTEQQLSKLSNPVLAIDPNTIITPVISAWNLGVLVDNHLSINSQISALSQSCFITFPIFTVFVIHLTLILLPQLLPLNQVHSKFNYCNSLYYSLPAYQFDRIQLIQNCLACTVCRTSKFSHITPSLCSLHWLKVRERIE